MIYAEGILVALAAPLMVLLFFAGTHTRRLLVFMCVGMLVCLTAAYVNSFFASLVPVDSVDAVVVIAPMVEEIAKYLPLAFYVVVFEPSRRRTVDVALAIGAGFAIFENAVYLTENGAENIFSLAARGLAVGAMHAGCMAFIGIALSSSREADWPRFTAMAGVLCIAIIYHALYNLLVSFPGPMQWVGYALPLVFAVFLLLGDVRHHGISREQSG